MKTTISPSLLTPTPPVTFPRLASCVRCARRWAEHVLGSDHPLIDEALMVLSELAANAVEHTKGSRFTVAIAASPAKVRVEVADEGADGTPAIREAFDERGRGLFVVNTLAARWGHETTDTGRTVWAEIATAVGT